MSSSPDFAAIDDAWNVTFVVCILLFGISFFSFLLRFLSRLLAHEGLRLDDFFIAFAMILATTLSGFNAWLSKRQSPANLAEVDGTFYQKMNLISHLLWITALWIITCSVFAFYWRLFRAQLRSRMWKRWLWISFALVFAWWFTSLFLTLFIEKGEVDGYWTTDPNTLYLFRIAYTFALHIILDVNVLLAPYFWIAKTEDRISRRLILLLFFAGISTTVFSTTRFIYLIERYIASKHNESGFELGIKAVMWSVVEVSVAIICANLPTYRYNDFGKFLSRIVEGNEPPEISYRRNYGRPGNEEAVRDDRPDPAGFPQSPRLPRVLSSPVSPLQQHGLNSAGETAYELTPTPAPQELRHTPAPQPELPSLHTGWASPHAVWPSVSLEGV